MPPHGYSIQEWRTLRSLKTPERIQRFLDEEIVYNKAPGGHTCYSPRMVLRNRVAHCMEGAMLAAAALEVQGYAPLILDLEAIRDEDHVIALFRVNGLWGAVAQSNYAGLRYRSPVYRTLRELAMSYFEHYFNLAGEKTLRTYSKAVPLRRFDGIEWRTREKDVWEVPFYLLEIRHTELLQGRASRRRYMMDRRLFTAEMEGRTDSRPLYLRTMTSRM